MNDEERGTQGHCITVFIIPDYPTKRPIVHWVERKLI